MNRTNFDTLSATNTLKSRIILSNIYVHLACTRTFSAAYTSILVNSILQNRDAIKQRIKSSKRANPFAEGAIKHDAQQHNGAQDAKLHREKFAKSCLNAAICQRKWNCSFKNSLWTNVLAEKALPFPQRFESKLVKPKRAQSK